MPEIETLVGLAAALLTSGSYLPQVWKAWRTRSVADLSLRMLVALISGLSLWTAYGVLRDDAVLVGANIVGISLLANLLGFKIAEKWRSRPVRAAAPRDTAPGSAGRS
jgi:MtN3 and saliva related transmembrane protein